MNITALQCCVTEFHCHSKKLRRWLHLLLLYVWGSSQTGTRLQEICCVLQEVYEGGRVGYTDISPLDACLPYFTCVVKMVPWSIHVLWILIRVEGNFLNKFLQWRKCLDMHMMMKLEQEKACSIAVVWHQCHFHSLISSLFSSCKWLCSVLEIQGFVAGLGADVFQRCSRCGNACPMRPDYTIGLYLVMVRLFVILFHSLCESV